MQQVRSRSSMQDGSSTLYVKAPDAGQREQYRYQTNEPNERATPSSWTTCKGKWIAEVDIGCGCSLQKILAFTGWRTARKGWDKESHCTSKRHLEVRWTKWARARSFGKLAIRTIPNDSRLCTKKSVWRHVLYLILFDATFWRMRKRSRNARAKTLRHYDRYNDHNHNCATLHDQNCNLTTMAATTATATSKPTTDKKPQSMSSASNSKQQ